MTTKSHFTTRMLTEGAMMVALAQVLSYVKLGEAPNGGAITPAMLSLHDALPILLSWRRRPTVAPSPPPCCPSFFTPCAGGFARGFWRALSLACSN